MVFDPKTLGYNTSPGSQGRLDNNTTTTQEGVDLRYVQDPSSNRTSSEKDSTTTQTTTPPQRRTPPIPGTSTDSFEQTQNTSREPTELGTPPADIVARENFQMPQIFIKNISLSEQTNKKNSEIKLGFKIGLNDRADSPIQIYDDKMVINVIQVKNKILYSFLNLSKELLWYMVNIEKLTALPQMMLNVSKNIGLTKNGTIEEIKQVFLDRKNVNIQTIFTKTATAVATKEIDKNGNIAINMDYNINFTNEIETEHLSYFVYADLEKDLLQQTEIDSQKVFKSTRVSSELVINENKIIPQTYAFYLPVSLTREKILWTDFKHFDGNDLQWYTGRITDDRESKVPLTREIFFNTKIKNNSIFSKIDENIGVTKQEIEKITSFISPIKMRGVDEQAIIFDVNTELLLEKYSPLYAHINALSLKNSDIIKAVSVFKKRVTAIKSISRVKDFSVNEPTILLKEPIIQIDNRNEINKITVIDNEIMAGKYCYGIKIDFSDVLKKELGLYLQELTKYENILYKYYSDSNISSVNYDAETGRFTDKFLQENMENKDVVKSVEIFLESYAKIVSNPFLIDDIKNQILIHISPKTGNPSSILRFLESYKKLIKHYKDILEYSSPIGVYREEKYFDKFEQVIEFERVVTNDDTTPGFLYGSFLDINDLIIEKKQNNKYVSIQKENVWDYIDNDNKALVTEWISTTNFILNKYVSVSNDDKYEKAISALKEIGIEQEKSASPSFYRTSVELENKFYLLTKSSKQIIQENLDSIYSSILSVPKEYVTNSIISDLSVMDVVNYR